MICDAYFFVDLFNLFLVVLNTEPLLEIFLGWKVWFLFEVLEVAIYLVQAGQSLQAVEVSSLPRYHLQARHHVLHQSSVDLVRELHVLLGRLLNSEQIDQIPT